MADPEIYLGREATIKVASSTTIDTSTTLENQINGDAEDESAKITEITVTDPEASVDIQNNFSGQIKTESPFDLVTIDFTARFKDLSLIEDLHGEAVSLSSGSEWVRVSGGATIGQRPEKSIVFKLSKSVDGTDYTIVYLMNNAWFQNMGEVSLSADGTAELTGTAVCLVEDRYIEKNFA